MDEQSRKRWLRKRKRARRAMTGELDIRRTEKMEKLAKRWAANWDARDDRRVSNGQLVSPEQVMRASTGGRGWTREQLRKWGVPWPPPRGWRKRLELRWHASRILGIEARKQMGE